MLGAHAPLGPEELSFLDLMGDQLQGLPLELLPDGSRRLGLAGEHAKALAQRSNVLGVAAYRASLTHAASGAFALTLRLRLQFSSLADRDTTTVLRHWAVARREDGEYEESLAGLRLVQELWCDIADTDPEALDNRNDIAVSLLDLGDFRKALEILRPLVAANRKARPGKRKDPHTLTSESNLADAMKMSGDFGGALRLAKRVLHDRTESPHLGPDHSDTLSSGNNVAELLQRVGDLQGALRLQEHVLARRRAAALDHTDTITAAANLATTYYALGEFQRALALERDVLRDRRERDGRSHPNTLIAANNLAGTLRDLGHFTEAGQLLRQVVRDHRRSVREAHPEALLSLTNLADLLREQGDLPGAGRLARKAWRLRAQVLSPEHPDTVTSMASYAAVLYGRKQYAQAARLQRQVLTLRSRDSGPDHVETLHAANDLANLLSKQGRHAEAGAIYADIEPRVLKALGQDHPDALEVRLSLAETFFHLGNKAKALALAQHVAKQVLSRTYLDARDFDRCSRLAAVLIMLDAHADLEALLTRISTMMWETLELVDQDSSQLLLGGYTSFHDTWVRHCLTHNQDDLLRALGPLHGLDSASWARADLSSRARSPGAAGEVREPYDKARRALHDSRVQLTQLDALLRTLGVQIAGESPASGLRTYRSQLLASRKRAVEEEAAAMATLRAAQDELRASEPGLDIGQRTRPPTTGDLRRQLLDNEGVLVLIQFTDSQTASVLLRRSGVGVTPLPALESLRAAFSTQNGLPSPGLRSGGFRGAVEDLIPADAAQRDAGAPPVHLFFDASKAEQDMRAALWSAIEPTLAGLDRLHAVHSPTLRGLPLQLGRPIARTGHYPALPGFQRIFEATRATSDAMDTDLGELDIGFDCAWETPAPIPFAGAEAALMKAQGPKVTVSGGRAALEKLTSGMHAPNVQLACHGSTAGEDANRFSVLLLDAETGARLDPGHLLSLPGTIDELVCSTCVGGIVSQRVAVDAMGIVSAMQLKGTRSVVACLAPISDFHMPMLMTLYRHHRIRGISSADALQRAKLHLRSGDWPADIPELVERAYGSAMEEVLLRAQYAGPPTGDRLAKADRARRLARSVAGWVLPDVLQQAVGEPSAFTAEAHQKFSHAWCESTAKRAEFSHAAARCLVETRAAWPAPHRVLAEHLCAFTQCFGGVH